jgi:cyclic-di-AMP phosphodiesterase PgpH
MNKNRIFSKFEKIINRRNFLLYRVSIIILLFLIIFALIIFEPTGKIFKPKLGDVLKEDIIVDKDLRYLDEEATKRNKDAIKSTTPPVFIINTSLIQKRTDELIKLINKIKISSNQSDLMTNENFIKLNFEDSKKIKQLLIENPACEDDIIKIFSEMNSEAIFELTPDLRSSLENSGLLIGKYKNSNLIETLYSVEEIKEKSEISIGLKENIEKKMNYLKDEQKQIIFSLLEKTITSNVFLDKDITDVRLKNKLRTDTNVYRTFKIGQVIARKGDILTEESISKINVINMNKDNQIDTKNILGVFILLALTLVFSYFFVNLQGFKFYNDIKNIIFISTLILIYVLNITMPIYFGIDKSNPYYGLFIPVSTFSLTLVFLYSQPISLFFTIIFSVLFLLISGFNYLSFIFVFFSGIFSVFTITKVKKRVDLLVAGLLIAFLNLVIALAVFLFLTRDVKPLNYFLIALFNGIVSSIIAIGIIPIGEIILNSPTIFKLQELSDPSSNLMRELFDSAVGSYNHSILVANLAEAAATEIGVNGLLARVGGYYHDIGKTDNPEYFIENQGKFNIHNSLKPSISATVIKSHVRKGVERAKNASLPQKVIDIIAQHHGNSLIKFFYEKALKLNIKDKEDIQEDVFRYKEDIPQFPEAAIVLLADQVEAYSRVIKKVTMTSIEKLVENVIDTKFQEGIMDDSGLTLKDITKIKKVFVKHLLGMYHSRIEYPQSTEKTRGNVTNGGVHI